MFTTLLARKGKSDLCDIYDGRNYQYYRSKGLLGEYCQLSFSVSVDGIRGYQHGLWKIYPIWISTNELPPNMRTLPEHVFLYGLWFDKTAPRMNTFLSPLVDELIELSDTGYEVEDFDGDSILCKALMLNLIVDTPGKSHVLNHKYFSGQYGCCLCTHPGSHIGGKCYYDPLIIAPNRTADSYFAAMEHFSLHPEDEFVLHVFMLIIVSGSTREMYLNEVELFQHI